MQNFESNNIWSTTVSKQPLQNNLLRDQHEGAQPTHRKTLYDVSYTTGLRTQHPGFFRSPEPGWCHVRRRHRPARRPTSGVCHVITPPQWVWELMSHSDLTHQQGSKHLRETCQLTVWLCSLKREKMLHLTAIYYAGNRWVSLFIWRP